MGTERIDANKRILGYMLKERIGAGGYGEVWSAEAPGGIAKAVKLVYGYHDENRAQSELKSLNRVRELRHPFLLSLERIEVVDGQLVVITELADQSLKDRFDECVQADWHGIPRDELLKYINEAAEALDFISHEHRLQHLDVKPENLLMVSGHIKVADFGLVKELQDTNQSLMGGLTPIYAPPELFDGRPSRSSDQYSLAIVYQEMLTGTRPFSGTTAAQLASQHMNARPRLTALPRGDQAVILRALSKDPDLRFKSCAEMVEALSKRKANSAKAKQRPMALRTATNTSVIGESTLEKYVTAAELTKLDPIEVDQSEAGVTPTLFIGVGQTGTGVIKSLRRKLCEQIGTDEDYPAFSFLCLDTDDRDLVAACSANGGALRLSDTLAIPLKKPEEYRQQGSLHHSWLSRRWIYNVPRSLRTEGIRPLGRLAFADHHEKIFQQLHERLEDITKAECLAETAETLDLQPVSSRVRVFIVGSIAGGVGSGMLLDLAYATRTVLLEQGIPDEDVIGVLLHSTGRTATERDLTVANTCAFLGEMSHFAGTAGYPGDETCGLPPFEDDSRPFSTTYVVHLGDNLSQLDYDNSVDGVAEYLFLNAASACGSYFDTCRSEESDANQMCTFNVRSANFADGEFNIDGDDLARLALDRWTDNFSTPQYDAARTEQSRKLLQTQQVTIDGLTSEAYRIIETHLQQRPDEFVAQVVSQGMQQTATKSKDVPAAVLESVSQAIAQMFQCSPHDESGVLCTKPPQWAAVAVSEFAGRQSAPLKDTIVQRINTTGGRFGGANALRTCLMEQAGRIADELREGRKGNLTGLQEAEQQLGPEAGTPILDASELSNAIGEYAQRRLRELILFVAEQLATGISSSLLTHATELRPYENALRSCLSELDDATPVANVASLPPEQLDKLLTQIDQQLETHLYVQYEGLIPFLQVINDSRRRDLMNLLHNAACRASRQIRRGFDIETALSKSGIVGDAAADWVEKSLGGATPALAACGGGSRLLLAVPDRSTPRNIGGWVSDRLEERPTVIPATSGNVVVCHEINNVPLGNMVYQFYCQHPESIEYVSRIHTRIDIDWAPLSPSALN